MQHDLKNTHQEIDQYTTGDKIEVLEDFAFYNNVGNELNKKNFEFTPDTFKNPRMKEHLKAAFVDCIHHHEEIMSMAKEFEELTSSFFLIKLGDITGLLTLILFAIVRKF